MVVGAGLGVEGLVEAAAKFGPGKEIGVDAKKDAKVSGGVGDLEVVGDVVEGIGGEVPPDDGLAEHAECVGELLGPGERGVDRFMV